MNHINRLAAAKAQIEEMKLTDSELEALINRHNRIDMVASLYIAEAAKTVLAFRKAAQGEFSFLR